MIIILFIFFFQMVRTFAVLQQSFKNTSMSMTSPLTIRRKIVPIGNTNPTILIKTSLDDIPKIIENVAAKQHEWKSVPVTAKIDLLKQIRQNTINHVDEWNSITQKDRGVHPTDPNHGNGRMEITTVGPYLLGSIVNGLISSLENIHRTGHPPLPKRFRTTDEGKCIVQLSPNGLLESLENAGMTGHLILKGDQPDQLSLDEVSVGGLAGILGGGNFNSPSELFYELFLKSRVCVYKPNPVNQSSCLVLRKILEPLVSAGYVDFIIGGTEEGSAMLSYEGKGGVKFDEFILTGSQATLDKIEPIANAPIIAELGGVNPWIIVPGIQWNKRSIDSYARMLAWAKMFNNGHICAAPQIVILPSDWKFRQEFMSRLRYWLAEHAGSPAFYPGSSESQSFFQDHYQNEAELIRGKTPDVYDKQQRPMLLSNVTIDKEDILTREAFCPVLAEVPLDFPTRSGSDEQKNSVEFLRLAVDYTAKHIHNSLTAVLLIDDNTLKGKYAKDVDSIVADIPVGTVGINIPTLYATNLPHLTWGAFPGRTQSGSGVIGNTFLYKNVEKSLVVAPFSWIARPLFYVNSPKKTDLIGRRTTQYRLRPNFSGLLKALSATFLGI